MDISVRVEVQYLAPDNASLADVLRMLRRPAWVQFMMQYVSPRLRTASPVDKNVLRSLHSDWVLPQLDLALDPDHHLDAPDEEMNCAICLAASPDPAHQFVRLPCHHVFHGDCIEAWLKMRSTCPICRFQLQKAFAGIYAVRRLTSTVRLDAAQSALATSELVRSIVAGQAIRAVVTVELGRVADDEEHKTEYPCEIRALLLRDSGELFSELEAPPQEQEQEQEAKEHGNGNASAQRKRRGSECCDLVCCRHASEQQDATTDSNAETKRVRRD